MALPAAQNLLLAHCCRVVGVEHIQPTSHVPSLCASAVDRTAGHHAPSELQASLVVGAGQ